MLFRGHFVVRNRFLPAAPAHDFVKRLEISPGPADPRNTAASRVRDLLRDGSRDELVDTRAILFADSLDRLFQRSRKSERVCSCSFIVESSSQRLAGATFQRRTAVSRAR